MTITSRMSALAGPPMTGGGETMKSSTSRRRHCGVSDLFVERDVSLTAPLMCGGKVSSSGLAPTERPIEFFAFLSCCGDGLYPVDDMYTERSWQPTMILSWPFCIHRKHSSALIRRGIQRKGPA